MRACYAFAVMVLFGLSSTTFAQYYPSVYASYAPAYRYAPAMMRQSPGYAPNAMMYRQPYYYPQVQQRAAAQIYQPMMSQSPATQVYHAPAPPPLTVTVEPVRPPVLRTVPNLIKTRAESAHSVPGETVLEPEHGNGSARRPLMSFLRPRLDPGNPLRMESEQEVIVPSNGHAKRPLANLFKPRENTGMPMYAGGGDVPTSNHRIWHRPFWTWFYPRTQ